MANRKTSTDEHAFKFKELKVYSSTEWLAENKKKYRQVFDRSDTSYIYAELSFFNKRFDEEDWEVNVELICYAARKRRKEICHLSFRRNVSRHDPVVYIREGWGNKKPGAFWKRGSYNWEAWIDGVKVGTKSFFVEEHPESDNQLTPQYVEVESLKLYEGPHDDIIPDDRIYFKTFSSEETRYIYLEIMLRNLNPIRDWHCELFVKFYNDARELKGQVVKLQKVEKDTNLISVSAGWGSNTKGSWRMDHYTAELIFMNKLLAVVPFEVGDEAEDGLAPALLPNRAAPIVLTLQEDLYESFEEVMSKMNHLIGLHSIKQQVRDHAQYLQFLQLRQEKGFKEEDSLNVHAIFIGNPGTGKTTVAKMMGKLYKKMGLLSKGHIHEVDRVDLVGEYIGQTAPKVREAIEKARGGVLFIDEAYALARSSDDTKDFGREVIEILVKEMSNGKGDLAIIAAGYPREMQNFLDSNPGLNSRFKLHFEFPDYLPQELIQIAEYATEEKGVQLSQEARQEVEEIITEAYRTRSNAFGNARFVHDLIDKAKINLGLRIMESETPREQSKEALSLILKEDVEKIQLQQQRETPNIPVDEKALKKALRDLDQLVGIAEVKREIYELVHLVRYYRESQRDVLNNFHLHTVFVGNPGTGKTTVARILTRIYKALGILERGHMVETDRQGLVAGYVGQTAIKTAKMIEDALGGVLFIDEAYALTQASQAGRGDFGDEAIQTLLKRMEDQRGTFFVFAAGYPDQMEAFLKANPGLSSRFDKILKFEDYNTDELLAIAHQMLEQAELYPSPEAEEYLRKFLENLVQYKDKYFGNARTIRSMVDEIIKHQHLRLARLNREERLSADRKLIQLEDIAKVKLDQNQMSFTRGSGIGFKRPSPS